MGCRLYENCGGCVYRQLETKAYQKQKEQNVRALLEKNLGDLEGVWETPIFLPDGTRRRAAFAFEMKKQKLVFGFNENKSDKITDICRCDMLTEKINAALADVRALVEKLCLIEFADSKKGKKAPLKRMTSGDFQILEAENGLDAVLEADIDLSLDHRFEIADFMNAHEAFIRFSFRKKHAWDAEPVVQKAKPFVKIGKTDVFVSAGDFLQPSKEGQEALISLVEKYAGDTKGKTADLFCGIGTFSYALANVEGRTVLAVDASKPLLQNFQKSVDAQIIGNIQILQKDLFLYPMDANELKNFGLIVFDPPRAGAKAQAEEFCKIEKDARPEKIVAVSCNPTTFARDAKILTAGGYVLKKITMTDQFVYSDHSEIVALFTNEK